MKASSKISGILRLSPPASFVTNPLVKALILRRRGRRLTSDSLLCSTYPDNIAYFLLLKFGDLLLNEILRTYLFNKERISIDY
ncbi:unnamed protein product [Victoria cruziana]